MLEKIKSSYIVKIIFSYIDEKTKLKLVKRNKNLQKRLNINVINYKILSEKYIIYETKEKGKEYDYEGDLIYEGEFLDGKRHGKGKEYDHYGLRYEGEYLNGKRHGKGKEFAGDGSILFEGEYLNGNIWDGTKYYFVDDVTDIMDSFVLKNGKGFVKYIDDGEFSYEGEYLNGKKNGKGKEYLYNDLNYEGEFLNDKRHGKGKEFYKKYKLKFEGEYLNGLKWNGKGYNKDNEIIYEIKNGKGIVKEYNNRGDQLIFEGEYLNGKRHGKGIEYFCKD